MRFGPVLLLAALLFPEVLRAQDVPIVLTNDKNIVRTDDGGKQVSTEDEGGYKAIGPDARGIIIMTWFQRRTWIDRSTGILPTVAIAKLTEKIQREPGDFMHYKYRGIAWRLPGEHDIAIADFDESLRLNPDQPDAYTQRGLAYYGRKGFDEHQKAKANFENEKKKAEDAYKTKETNFSNQNPNKSAEEKEMALAPDKHDMRIQVMQLKVAHAPIEEAFKTSREKAIDDFDRALRINENSAWTHYLRAITRLEVCQSDTKLTEALNGYKESKKQYTETKNKHEDDGKLHDAAKAKLKMAQEDDDKAQSRLQDQKKKLDQVTKDNKAAKTDKPAPEKPAPNKDAAKQAPEKPASNKDAGKQAPEKAAPDKDAGKPVAEKPASDKPSADMIAAQTAYNLAKNDAQKTSDALRDAETDETQKARAIDVSKKPFEDAAEKLSKYSVQMIFAQADLRDAIADFNDAIRLEPSSTAYVREKRKEAEVLLKKASVAKSEDSDDMIKINSKEGAKKAKKQKAATDSVPKTETTKAQVAAPPTPDTSKDPITVKLADPISVKIEFPADGLQTKLQEPINVSLKDQEITIVNFWPVLLVAAVLLLVAFSILWQGPRNQPGSERQTKN